MGVKEKVNHPPLAPPIKGGEYLVNESLIKNEHYVKSRHYRIVIGHASWNRRQGELGIVHPGQERS